MAWNHHHQTLLIHQYTQSNKLSLSSFSIKCSLTKQGERFLTSIAITNDPFSIDRKINKFVTCSPKSVVLGTLYHLLSPSIHSSQSHLSSLALPLYTNVTQVSWFSWNSKLVANVVASLYDNRQIQEAEALISETISTIGSKERDLVCFYCDLLDTLTKLKSENGFSSICERQKEILSTSSSVYVRKKAYESLVGGLCVMGLPHEAENLVIEMRNQGLKPSLFEFRSMIEGYGKLGLLEEMQHIVDIMEKNGLALDTITSNMVLNSYGQHNELTQMFFWLRKLKSLNITFSIRTYNSVLNSCPNIMSLLQDLKRVPISLKELISQLTDDEALLVQELIESPVLNETMTWESLQSMLDLHGMHLGTSYLILLQWMEELHQRLISNKYEIPAEVTLVTGSGKHSTVIGGSPVKALVKEVMIRTRSPMKIDRKNIGCFVAKGKSVKDWLC